MDAITAHELINHAGRARHRARGDRRATSVPLLAFGAITVLDAALRTMVDPTGALVMLLFAPVGFAAVALYYRHREIATGVGGRTRPYVIAAVVVLACLPLLAFFGAYALVGVGLVVIALSQHNLYLGVWAAVFGVLGTLGTLEAFYLISNRLYSVTDALGFLRPQDGYFSWAPSLVYGALGASLIGAGLYARRREVTAA